jgi:hypothetical protein
MLDRTICNACIKSLRPTWEPKGLNFSWCCPALEGFIESRAILIREDPPAGCLRLFEYAVLRGKEDVK